MTKITIRSIVIVVVSLLIATLVSKANEQFSVHLGDYSLYWILGGVAFLVNWLAFIPAYKFQTEHYYDLTGSITYLTVLLTAVIFGNALSDPRALLVSLLACVWTLRLGSFLFFRIKRAGSDTRFDEIKPVFSRFFAAWTLQGLWVFITLAAALAVITSTNRVPLDAFALIGFLVWLFGFSIEVIADQQKSAFKNNPENKGRFISTGLWAYSRHPNYFGEITLWTGVFIICIPALQGWQWVTIISPIFVYLLLTKVSGVNMLEDIADKRWGGQADYEAYKSRTSVLLLRPQKNGKLTKMTEGFEKA